MSDANASELPHGWEWTSLGEIVEFLDSKRVPVNEKEREERIAGKSEGELFPYYGANGQVGWIDDYLFDEPLVLLAEDGGFFETLGRVAYEVAGRTWVNNHAHVLKPLTGIDLRYVHFALNSMNLMPFVSGTTRLKLNQGNAQRIPVPLAPQNEQTRITAKIEELFQELTTAGQALRKVPSLMKQFHQSILSNAFRGELTERDPNDEPAEKLLERIQQVRQTKWEEEIRAQGKDSRKYKYVEPEKPNSDGLVELPENWVWVRLQQIAEVMDVDHKMPKAASIGVPLISPKDFRGNNQIDFEGAKTISVVDFQHMSKKCRVRPGDLLYSRIGTVGKVRIAPNKEFGISYSLAIMRPVSSDIDNQWLWYLLQTDDVVRQAMEKRRSIGVPDLGLKEMKNFVIPLSPVAEQARIVFEIKKLFSIADGVERSVESSVRSASRLEQAVLAKAFRGELVQQDSNDEPATALLERIKSARTEPIRRRGK